MRGLAFVLFAAVVASGCSTAVQSLSPTTVYRADMGVSVNGASSVGVASLPKAAKYDFTFQASDDMDYFVFRTCHREQTSESQPEKVKYSYTPQSPIETDACPAEIEGLNKKGKHAFAFVAFSEDSKTLPAKTLKCNGATQSNTPGVTVCQAGAGLEQYIEFAGPTVMSDAGIPACALPDMPHSGTSFTWKMAPGRCVYTFQETADAHRRHRLWTRGYGAIILLGN